MSNGILMEMTIDDVRALAPEVVVLGVGSTEPHGPVLPYGTDFYQCDGVVREAVILANRRGGRVLMYPTLAIGNNVNFKAWPFACRIRVQTLMQVVLDILAAIAEDGVRKIVLVNGHGGNTDCLHATLRAFHDTQPVDGGVFVCMPGGPPDTGGPRLVEHGSPHGGESETSRMLHHRPDLVRTDKMGVNPFGKLAVEALGRCHFVHAWHRRVPASGGGDNRLASPEKGAEIVRRSVEYLADLLVQLSQAPWTEAFPYEPGS